MNGWVDCLQKFDSETSRCFSQYHKVAVVGACSMTCAVVYLRYHYFVDALFASVLVYSGLVVGRMTDQLRQDDTCVAPQKVGASSIIQPLKAMVPAVGIDDV